METPDNFKPVVQSVFRTGYRMKFDEKMAALIRISLSTKLAARPR